MGFSINWKNSVLCFFKIVPWLMFVLRRGIQGRLTMLGFTKNTNLLNSSMNAISLKQQLELNWNIRVLSKSKDRRLLFAIWDTFKSTIVTCLVIRIMDRSILMALERYYLGRLVTDIRHYSVDGVFNVQSKAWLVFVLIAPTRVVMHRVFYFLNKLIGMQIRVAVSSLFYKKVLRLSQRSLAEFKTGDFLSVVSTGSAAFENSFFILALITGPLQLITQVGVLWVHFGAASFSGVLILIILSCWQSYMGKVSSEHQAKISASSTRRTRIMAQILAGIKTIKLYTLEQIFISRVKKARAEECNLLRKAFSIECLRHVVMICSPLLAMLVTVSTYLSLEHEQSLEQIIVASTIFYHLRALIFVDIPTGVKQFGNLLNGVAEFEKYMSLKETQKTKVRNANAQVNIKHLSISSDLTDINFKKFLMKNVNIELSHPCLAVIIGKTGVGKTLFLKALMGEWPIHSGTIRVNGRISYAAQDPWIFAGTIRDNIIFYSNFDVNRYSNVLRICALEEDLNSFNDGDNTILSADGVELSGGQKARVSLARAAYAEADIYILDDVLSNIDTKVATHIQTYCINEFLKNKIRIQVTSSLEHIKKFAKVLYFKNESLVLLPSLQCLEPSSISETTEFQRYHISISDKKKNFLQKSDIEHADTVQICWKYLTIGCGYSYIMQYIASSLALIAVYHIMEYSLQMSFQTTSLPSHVEFKYFEFFCGILLLIMISSIQNSLLLKISLNGGKQCHDRMLQSIMFAPLKFFTDHCHILERFTTDMAVVDQILPLKLYSAAHVFLMYLSGYAMIILKFGIKSTFPLIFLFIFGYLVQKYNIQICLQLNNFSHNARDAAYSFLMSSVKGIATIRIMSKESEMESQYDKALNTHFLLELTKLCFDDISTLFIDITTVGILSVLVVIATFFPESRMETVFPPLIGFGATIGFAFSQGVVIVANLRSAGAVIGLHNIAPEASVERMKRLTWRRCRKEKIRFSKVSVRYHTKTTVLKKINFSIKSGEKVALVGRTGCGKSTLISALARLVEYSGDIFLDGHNISKLSTSELRRKVLMIPQDSYLFDETLRSSLDPFGEFSDKEITGVFNFVFGRTAPALPHGLETKVGEGGNIFSAGQKQLLSFTRAMLQKPSVLVLDEPTANLNAKTAEAILEKLMKCLTSTTVIVSLHQLSCIKHFDRVLLISKGGIASYRRKDFEQFFVFS